VMVVGVPRTHYLKAAQFNSVDALNGLLRIDGDPRTTLDVLISPNPGTFEAMIVNDRGESVQGAVVVLAPDPSRRNRSELYRTANSDASGRIRIEGIVPGDYKIFAWEDVESGVWQDPEFMRAHEDRGKAVHISEGGRENTEVRIIPNR